MVILLEGFALPPFPYPVALVAGLVGVGVGLTRTRPTVAPAHVLALVPWMVSGSALYVLYVVNALPSTVEPLAGTPAAYLSVAVVAGAMWLAFDAADLALPQTLVAPGLLVAADLAGFALFIGLAAGTFSVVWPDTALVTALVVTPLMWRVVTRLVPEAAAAGPLGLLAFFGHALNVLSTAVGVDVPGFDERTPLSHVILDATAALPTAEVIGVGWLFVLVKLAVAGFVVALLVDYVREDPTEGSLLSGLVAAVGLGPGVHNLPLFTIAG